MNQKQQAFVCEMLRHGNRAEAYRNAYHPKSDNPRSLQSAAGRLMKNPEVAEAIWSAQERIYAEVYEDLKARVLREELTVQRKREILAQIAEGDWIIQPPPDEVPDQPTAVLIPTLKERLKAIDMDNKMTGAYRNENIGAQPAEREEHNLPNSETGETTEVQQKTTIEEPSLNNPTAIAPCTVFFPLHYSKEKKPFMHPGIKNDPRLNKPATCTPTIAEVRTFMANKPAQQPSWMETIRL